MRIFFALLFTSSALISAAQTVNPGAQPPANPAMGQTPTAGAPGSGQQAFPTGAFSNVMGTAGTFLSNQFGLQGATNSAGDGNVFRTGNYGLNDVQALLETLQANLEQTIPVLTRITSGNQGVDRTTGLPNQFVNSVAAGQQPQAFYGVAGTNAVAIDQQTYRSLVVLQNHLQQTLLSLREVNGSPGVATSQNAGRLTPTGLTNRISTIPNDGSQNRVLQNPVQPQNMRIHNQQNQNP
jgi:hypothetical protein